MKTKNNPEREARIARARAAKFVVMTGESPYEMYLCTYPAEICLGGKEGAPLLSPIGDGFSIDLELAGFATVEDARIARDEYTQERQKAGEICSEMRIIGLPIKINKNSPQKLGRLPGEYFDPSLTLVAE